MFCELVVAAQDAPGEYKNENSQYGKKGVLTEILSPRLSVAREREVKGRKENRIKIVGAGRRGSVAPEVVTGKGNGG